MFHIGILIVTGVFLISIPVRGDDECLPDPADSLLDRRKLPFPSDPLRLLNQFCRKEIEDRVPWLPSPFVFKSCKKNDKTLEIELGNELNVSCEKFNVPLTKAPLKSLTIPLACETYRFKAKKDLKKLGVESLRFFREDFDTPSEVCFEADITKSGKADPCGCLDYIRVIKFLTRKNDPGNQGLVFADRDYLIRPLSCISTTQLDKLNQKFHGVPKDYLKMLEKLKIRSDASPVFLWKKTDHTEVQIMYLTPEGEIQKKIFHSFHNDGKGSSATGEWIEIPDLSSLPPEPVTEWKPNPGPAPRTVEPYHESVEDAGSSSEIPYASASPIPTLGPPLRTVQELESRLTDLQNELDHLERVFQSTGYSDRLNQEAWGSIYKLNALEPIKILHLYNEDSEGRGLEISDIYRELDEGLNSFLKRLSESRPAPRSTATTSQ